MQVDDGARHIHPVREELSRLGHEVVAVVGSPLVIHDYLRKLAMDKSPPLERLAERVIDAHALLRGASRLLRRTMPGRDRTKRERFPHAEGLAGLAR